MSICPSCAEKGWSVDSVTLESQVDPTALSRIPDRSGWSFCNSSKCEVVYFRAGDVVNLASVEHVPFQKSSEPGRLVCFCFEHSVEHVARDVDALGRSSTRESIKTACKAGLDSCTVKNPQGRCCLGNVGQVIREREDSAEPPARDCCAEKKAKEETSVVRSGLFASTGAAFAAVLSSACCWLPLLAVSLGVSVAGVGAFFETFRVPLLLVTAGLLGGGFYFAYRRPACAEDGTCEVPNTGVSRLNRALLWFTTLLVIAFAAFPQYVGAFTGGDEVSLQSETTATTYYTITGMTCGGCEIHTREAIEEVRGVVSAAVSFRDERARVDWDRTPDHGAVIAAVEGAGYRAEVID